ncbi:MULTISPECIES: carotenoid biosynthesis protein [unclassified Solwaraspora]|uniref:carotenoid biosynthesis protein n=1 Tax=unclassified Solwaraspora TaxID=2627926 RepID=UPI00259B9A13|nr:carotenoid biosynthesis protein [Solwaraspora sp. WMMA2056]WJK43688.1 carotenoid biosynthesis protein [Solwaraspora sp. WMMA2056]
MNLRRTLPWAVLALLVAAQIGYPLTGGGVRAGLTVATVVIGFVLSVGHAVLSRGPRSAAALVLVTTGGGLAVEACGVATGFPFGGYDYAGTLGPKLLGVPVIIPLAWTWMAWPAWLVATRLVAGAAVRSAAARVAVGAVALAAWDLFLDPQMVAEGHWTWLDTEPALPGVADIPVGNYLGWLAVAAVMMALLQLTGAAGRAEPAADQPMYALYLWTYASSVLAHAVFLGLPASAGWGGLGMGLVAVPFAVALIRARRR